jgi:hypothetical protein
MWLPGLTIVTVGEPGVRGEGPARRGRFDEASSLPVLADVPSGRRVLVVGTDDWAVEQSAAALEGAGFGVLRCHEPGEPAFPCNALIEGRTCPLEVGFDVVATVRARPLDAMAQGEIGVICALRKGIPLVAAGVAPDRPFGPWAAVTVEQGGDLVEACEKVASDAFAELAAGGPGGGA